MELLELLSILFRWLHLLPAIILLGGGIFMRLALIPALQATGVDQQGELREAVRRRWARLVMVSVGLLLISGIYNFFMKAKDYQLDGLYLGLMSVKFLLALVIFYLASLLSGRSEAAQRFRQKQAFWVGVSVILGVLLVCIAGVMKMTQQTQKDDPEQLTLSVSPLPEVTELPISSGPDQLPILHDDPYEASRQRGESTKGTGSTLK